MKRWTGRTRSSCCTGRSRGLQFLRHRGEGAHLGRLLDVGVGSRAAPRRWVYLESRQSGAGQVHAPGGIDREVFHSGAPQLLDLFVRSDQERMPKNGERNQATSSFATCIPIRSASMVMGRYAITYEQAGLPRAARYPYSVFVSPLWDRVSWEPQAVPRREGGTSGDRCLQAVARPTTVFPCEDCRDLDTCRGGVSTTRLSFSPSPHIMRLVRS